MLDNLGISELALCLLHAGCYLLVTSSDEKAANTLLSNRFFEVPCDQDSFLLEEHSKVLLPEVFDQRQSNSIDEVLWQVRHPDMYSDIKRLATFPRGMWIPKTILQSMWKGINEEMLQFKIDRLQHLVQKRPDCGYLCRLLPQLHEACKVPGGEKAKDWLRKDIANIPKHESFFLENGPTLLREAGEEERLSKILMDTQFLQKRLDHCGLAALLQDLQVKLHEKSENRYMD